MRVVIDTDVLLSGLRSEHGASRVLIIAAREGILRPVINVGMVFEYEAVLKRSSNLTATGLTSSEVDAFLEAWIILSDRIVRHHPGRPHVMDPNDAVFADAAVAGLADALITFNISDYRLTDPRGGRLPVATVRPGEFLRGLTWRPSTTSLSAFLRRC
jgi:putative PIN family toxin of toxin-antitoxin system